MVFLSGDGSETTEEINTYETFAIIIFIIEWLCRVWVSSHARKHIIQEYEKSELLHKPYSLKKSLHKIAKEKFAFILSPMSIIDLLAILPYYRPLRLLRIFMLFRLFKVLRYTNSLKQFRYVFIEKKVELFTLAIMFLMIITFGSTVIYIFEGAGVNPNIYNFFDAVYWSVITISTVGFGDISPVTTPGKLATLFLVIGGISVIAFFTSTVTTALHEKLPLIKQEKTISEASSMEDFTIICGFGKMGQIVAQELLKSDYKIIVIDKEKEQLQVDWKKNILRIDGDATDSALLLQLGVNKGAKNIIALTNDDATNLSIVLTAKAHAPNINIIARANTPEVKNKLLLAGANQVVSINEIVAQIATEYIGQPVAFNAIDDILLNTEGAIIDEIKISENSPLIGATLNCIEFFNYNLTLLGIIEAKNNKKLLFNPKKDQYTLKSKDVLIVMGYKDSIIELKIDILNNKKFLKKRDKDGK